MTAGREQDPQYMFLAQRLQVSRLFSQFVVRRFEIDKFLGLFVMQTMAEGWVGVFSFVLLYVYDWISAHYTIIEQAGKWQAY